MDALKTIRSYTQILDATASPDYDIIPVNLLPEKEKKSLFRSLLSIIPD